MKEITNQQVIDRYLKRFSPSQKSQSTRKYALEYFFRSDNFGYNGHIFSITKRDSYVFFMEPGTHRIDVCMYDPPFGQRNKDLYLTIQVLVL